MIVAVALLDASKSGNELRDSIAKLTKTAKQNKAQIIVLPELSYSGYNPDRFAKDATLLDETASFFGDLARDNRIFIIAGAAVKSNNLTTNSALVFDNLGSLVSKYDKIHLFSKTAEQDVFSCGSNLVSFEVGDKKFGIFICYDLRFPEIFSAMYDVDAFLCIAAWPIERAGVFELLLRARAIENCKPIFVSNWTGESVNSIKYGCGAYAFDALGEKIDSKIVTGCAIFEFLPSPKDILDSTDDKRFDLYVDFYSRFIK